MLPKPRNDQIRQLARREASPENVASFAPIVRGPWVALAILALVGLASAPWIVWRLVARLWSREE